MKKQYIKPITELVELNSASFMVPYGAQSNPGVEEANSNFFDEEEEELWDKLDNSTGHVWD